MTLPDDILPPRLAATSKVYSEGSAWPSAIVLEVLACIDQHSEPLWIVAGTALGTMDGGVAWRWLGDWHCEQNHDETFGDLARRSVNEAREYVLHLLDNVSKTIYYDGPCFFCLTVWDEDRRNSLATYLSENPHS